MVSTSPDPKDAGSVSPKVVEPEVLSETSKDQAAKNIREAANNNDVADGVDLDAVKAAADEGLKTDIDIESADKDLDKQTEAVEKVFSSVSADLAGATNSTGGKGLVITAVLPKMTPKVDGFYPLRVNHRHLLPDPNRRLRFWLSVEHFLRYAQGRVSVAGAESKEGDFFFLDENGVPTAVVSGDASKMVAVACLKGGETYDSAFITVDATEKDQDTLTDLKENATGNGAPTSDKDGGGGCDAGLGSLALLALAAALPLMLRRGLGRKPAARGK